MNPQRKSLILHISHQVLPSHSDTWWTMFLVHAPWGRSSNHRRRWLRLLLKKEGSFLQEKWRLLSTAYLPIDLRMFEIFCSCFPAQHITNLLRGSARHSGQGAPTTSITQICLQASAGGDHWGSSRLHLCWADDNNQHSHFLSCFILHLNLNFRLVSWVHGQRCLLPSSLPRIRPLIPEQGGEIQFPQAVLWSAHTSMHEQMHK